ncbi:hypothetical protein KIPB_014623, partial [Kipferlia bialata]
APLAKRRPLTLPPASLWDTQTQARMYKKVLTDEEK